jgi:trehalose 6-phosphate synthase
MHRGGDLKVSELYVSGAAGRLSSTPGGQMNIEERRKMCLELQAELLGGRTLVIAANRGPVTFSLDNDDEFSFKRSGGGLVTALTGLAQNVEATWIASASTPADAAFGEGEVPIDEAGDVIRVKFIHPTDDAYDQYYNVIANPLLWFLQHNMWNIARAPTINRETWRAWDEGYVAVNRMFAKAIAEQIRANHLPSLVMLQDYQLYLAPKLLREILADEEAEYTLTHFIHIPWPGPEDWGFLPPAMRRKILEGLCAVDLLGFQTREDALSFIRTCETHLPRADVNYTHGRIWYQNHATFVRDFPISIDVEALMKLADSEQVSEYRSQFAELSDKYYMIVRIDRTEPSKNIVRGFQAFDELLDLHPEYQDQVVFLAVLAPSRLEVEEYKSYLDEIMAAIGRVNAKHGSSEWEPIRILVGDDYPRAIAALQVYDTLLVNSIADGMNLVAKEGSIVNRQDGTLILSDRTGARQQLEPGALVISPCDVYATAEALHQSIQMSLEDRKEKAARLRYIVEREDIRDWLCRQLEAIRDLGL